LPAGPATAGDDHTTRPRRADHPPLGERGLSTLSPPQNTPGDCVPSAYGSCTPHPHREVPWETRRADFTPACDFSNTPACASDGPRRQSKSVPQVPGRIWCKKSA
jgi:hypothetical protein